jgi:hypothetical protein
MNMQAGTMMIERSARSTDKEFVNDHPRRVTVVDSPESWDRPRLPMSQAELQGLMPLALSLVPEIFGPSA